MGLTLKDIEARVGELGDKPVYDREFLFDLLLAYGRTKANVTRLKSTSASSLNVADDPATEIAQKNVVYFKEVEASSDEELLGAVEELSSRPSVVKYNTRFVIVTDYSQMLAKDTKTGENLIINIADIGDHFTFFLPWAGMEKSQYTAEAHADVKAAERMAKLFDELVTLNPDATQSAEGRHSLNVFFTRLLFCYFAEDTGIFDDNQFTRAVESLTQPDGSDMRDFLTDLFLALDTESEAAKPAHLSKFPYVNGRLFAVTEGQAVPEFNKKARDFLLESGKLQWSEINPDIFGSMFQAIVAPGQRSDLGQHYTSVPNILKTIEPLFLDELKEEFEAGFDNEKKLTALLRRISKIKVFDPACGSGNFLIIAYKELRKLEHAILEQLSSLRGSHQTIIGSDIDIENFYGIEIDDFAVEVAILSLWIAKHQMNLEFKQKFGAELPLIPLKEMGQVIQGNAARVDWNDVCPNDGETEIYLIGNPPYAGSSMQSVEQKEDLGIAYGARAHSKNLDYVSIWFIKGADYIQKTKAQLAFVSTNSIAQGEHVGMLFPTIFEMGIEIGYAYTSFKWENNARGNAGVTVVVVSLREIEPKDKYLFVAGIRRIVTNINGYLSDAPSIVLSRSSSTKVPWMPRMVRGSQPSDGGGLILEPRELEQISGLEPFQSNWIKKYVGSAEFIGGNERYCIWVSDEEVSVARQNTLIDERFRRISAFRSERNDKATRELSNSPNLFKQVAYKPTDSIIVPSISSERREYIPMGFMGSDTVISNKCFAIYDAEPWVFSLLTSRMHMAWTDVVSGRMRSDYQYSNTIVYNNFPVPELSNRDKEELDAAALRVLDVREYHSELTLADLYDPDKMPENLRLAHRELDLLVDSLYRKREFASDEDRLSVLFDMYGAMTANEGD